MADSVDFDLILHDKASGTADKVAAALKRVEDQQKKVNSAGTGRGGSLDVFSKQSAASLKFLQSIKRENDRAERDASRASAKAERDASRASASILRNKEKEIAATRRLGLAQIQAAEMNKKYNKEHGHGFVASFKSKLPFRSIGDYAKGAFWGHVAAEGVLKIGEGFLEGAHKAIEVLSEGVKHAFEEAGKQERLRLSYTGRLGEKGGREQLEDIERFSKGTRETGAENAELLRPLVNAGLKGRSLQSAAATAGDLGVRLGTNGSEFIDMFAKIKSKEGFSTKQLAGTGVSIPGLLKDLGGTLGVSPEQAGKLAKQGGKVDPQILLNAIQTAVEKSQGGRTAGSLKNDESKTVEARFHKLAELPNDYLRKISESPAWKKLGDRLGMIFEQLSPESPRGHQILSALFGAFDKIESYVERLFTENNIDDFLDELEKVPDQIDKIITVAELFATVWTGVKIVEGIEAITVAIETMGVATKLALGPLGALLASGAYVVKAATANESLIQKDEKNRARQTRDIASGNAEVTSDGRVVKVRKGGGFRVAEAGEDFGQAGPGGTVIHQKNKFDIHPAKDDTAHTKQEVQKDLSQAAGNAAEKGASERTGSKRAKK